MIETHTIERVFQRNHALDFVGPYHRIEHIAHAQRRLALLGSKACSLRPAIRSWT
jgi:hypothetical protein